jgi:tetratricopeptide (TPR) repeat protein
VGLRLAHVWWIRNAMLFFARAFRHIYYFAKSIWTSPLFWLVVTISVFAISDYMLLGTGKTWLQLFQQLWSQWWAILVAYTLIWLFWWALQARRHLVVEEFQNYVDEQFKADIQGMATLLVVRLGKLHELYRAVDEQRAIRTSVSESETIDATIRVEDLSAFLRDAVSINSELSLGPIKIPVGIILSCLGRLVQGPRLLGSVHRNKESFILTAQIIGGTYPYKWRVELPATEQHAGDLVNMVEELAYYVFTDIELQGSVRWQATRTFCDGLRAYRDCLQTPKDRVANLQKAEKQFIRTLTEDTEFDTAYYNLGVVYTELEHEESAEIAFDKAIAQDPNSWRAYYALALSRCANKKYYRSEQFCKRVIELNPGTADIAKAYQLLGVVRRKQEQQKNAESSYIEAITHSWVALCFATLKKRHATIAENNRVAQLETLASACLADLATMYNYKVTTHENGRNNIQNTTEHSVSNAPGFSEAERTSYCSKAEKLLKQALSLRHADATYNASYHFQLGQTYLLQKNYGDAVHELRVATRINPDHPEYWAFLVQAYAYRELLAEKRQQAGANRNHPGNKGKTEEREKALYQAYIFETIIDFASEVKKEDYKLVLKKAQEAACILHKTGIICTRIKELEAFLDLAYFLEALCDAMVAEKLDDLKARCKYYSESGYKLKDHEILTLAELCLAKNLDYDQLVQALKSLRLQGEDQSLRYAAISLALGGLYLYSDRKDDCKTLIDEMMQLVEQFNGKDREWEHGQLYRIVAALCSQADQLEQAAQYYAGAIEVLKEKYPREIRSQGLWLKLGNAFLKQQAYKDVWQTARDAIKHEPFCSANYKLLGEVYFVTGEFDLAIDAWQAALARENITMKLPHDPEICLNLAMAYEQKLQQTVDVAQKQSLIERIQTFCEQVREVDFDEKYKQQVQELLQRV